MTENRTTYGKKIIYRVTVSYRTAQPDFDGRTSFEVSATVEAKTAPEAIAFYLGRVERTHPNIINAMVQCSIEH